MQQRSNRPEPKKLEPRKPVLDNQPFRQSSLKPNLKLIPSKLNSVMNRASQGNQWPWYIWGGVGIGKTYAMAALYERWPHDAAFFCQPWFGPASKLIADFVDARVKHNHEPILNRIRESSLICVDDIGIREASPAQLDALLTILNTRSGLPMVITGNLAPEDLALCYDDRVVSRVCAGLVIECTGEDQRAAKSQHIKA